MQYAQGDYRVFSDADGSTPIQELEKLWPHFDAGADVVIGSRSMPKSNVEVRQHILRETMGRVFNLFVKTVVMSGFIDTQCGFKGFTRHSVEVVFPRQRFDGFSFDTRSSTLHTNMACESTKCPFAGVTPRAAASTSSPTRRACSATCSESA